MKRTIRHSFNPLDKLPVYSTKDGAKVIGHLVKGEWLGILAEEHRLYIISSEHTGWVDNVFDHNLKVGRNIELSMFGSKPHFIQRQ